MLLAITSNFTFANDKITGYRGEVLYFTDNPIKVVKAYNYYQDGVLYVHNGKVVEAGDCSLLQSKYKNVTIIDYSDKLIVPGFVDVHVHYPQTEVMVSYGDQLLTWLDNYIYPVERKFSDLKYATKISKFI